MKFSEYLAEAPLMMDIGKDELKPYISSYSKIMRSDPDKVGYFHEYNVYKYGKNGKINYAAVNDEKEDVVFDAHITTMTKPFKHYKQSLLWRDEVVTSEIVPFMFDIILEDLRTVFSDDIHTKGGKVFWKNLVKKYVGSSRYEVGYLEDNRTLKFEKDDWEETFESSYERENMTNRFYIKIK